jgi:hypothetical protein
LASSRFFVFDQRKIGFPRIVGRNGNGTATLGIGAFELQSWQSVPPANKEQCKNGRWMTFTPPRRFKNQSDCIQFVNTGK